MKDFEGKNEIKPKTSRDNPGQKLWSLMSLYNAYIVVLLFSTVVSMKKDGNVLDVGCYGNVVVGRYILNSW